MSATVNSAVYVSPKEWLIAAIGLLLGMAIYGFNVTGFTFDYFAGDLGDGRLNLYFLEHAHLFFSGKLSSYWDAPFMYPEPNVIAFSDNLLGTAPLYSLYRILGADLHLAYQLWFITLPVLNYIAAYCLLRYVVHNPYACVLGAVVFAFSLALHSQLVHAQTFPRFAIPLAIWMALRFRHSHEVKYFFAAVFFLVYQMYCGIYLGFMLSIPMVFLLLFTLKEVKWGAALPGRRGTWLGKLGMALLANIALLLPLMLPYMQRGSTPGIRQYRKIVDTIPTLKSYLSSVEGTLLWQKLAEVRVDSAVYHDHQLFAGALTTLAFVTAAFMFFRTFRKKSSLSQQQLMIATGLITFFIFLRVENISAYIFIYFIPGFSSMRALGRIVNIELIFFGFALAWLLGALFTKWKPYQAVLFVLSLGLLLADNYAHVSEKVRSRVEVAEDRLKPYESIFADMPADAVFVLEPDDPGEPLHMYQLDAMLLAQQYGLRTINAYTGRCPSAYAEFWLTMSAEARNKWLESHTLDFDTLYVIKNHSTFYKLSTEALSMDSAALRAL